MTHRILTPLFMTTYRLWTPIFLALQQHIEFWPPFFGAHRLLSPWVPGSLPTTFNEGVPPPPPPPPPPPGSKPSAYHRDDYIKSLAESAEWLLSHKGINWTCFREKLGCIHLECWFGELHLGQGWDLRQFSYPIDSLKPPRLWLCSSLIK